MTINEDRVPTDILELEALAQEDTKQKHLREIELFVDILKLFLSGFNRMRSFTRNEENEAEYIWLLIVTRCFHSIRCSIILTLKCYYSQAMSLLRTGTEDWFICGTCQSNEKVRDYLLHDKGRMPSYSSLAREMEATDVYEGDYRYQSKFTHSSRLSLRVLYDLDTKSLGIVPKYDKLLFLLCAESLARTSLMMAEYMGFLIFSLDEDKAKAWNDENSQRLKDITNWLKELREQSGKEQ